MNIDKALEEIKEARVNLNMIEAWLKKHAQWFEHSSVTSGVSTSINLSPPQIFVYAGPNPKEFARQFGGSCQIRGGEWEMKFASFQITMMDAAVKEDVVL